jgi:hypothetical protein
MSTPTTPPFVLCDMIRIVIFSVLDRWIGVSLRFETVRSMEWQSQTKSSMHGCVVSSFLISLFDFVCVNFFSNDGEAISMV